MTDSEKKALPPRSAGPFRGVLKLMVALDSSRFASNRVKSALLLVALLAVFALLGYGLPVLFSRYF